MYKILLIIIVISLELLPVIGVNSLSYKDRGISFPLKIITASSFMTISTQPADQINCKGNKVTFSVVTAGTTGHVSYSWKSKRPQDIGFTSFGAADSSKLPIPNIGVGDVSPNGTQYLVEITDELETVESGIATLTVNEITGIDPLRIANYTVCEGENIWFKVNTSGYVPTNYQWIRREGFNDWRDILNSSAISGANNNQINITKIAASDSGLYKVRVTFPTVNGKSCVETSTITRNIIVNNVLPGSIGYNQSIYPESIPDTIVSLTSGSAKNPPLSYMWEKSVGDSLSWQFFPDETESGMVPEMISQTSFFRRFSTAVLNNKSCKSIPTNMVSIVIFVDTSPPFFNNTDSTVLKICSPDPIWAKWDADRLETLTNTETSWKFENSDRFFDIDTLNFSDNIDSALNLKIHWGIYINHPPFLPVIDENNLELTDRTGQPSCDGSTFLLKGKNDTSTEYKIIYWLEDKSRNLTPVERRISTIVIVLPRPKLE